MSNDHQKNEEMKNRFASNDDEAESKYKEYKLVDPFPNIPPALLSSADILKYIAVTGMIFPFHPEPEKKHMKQASYGVRMIGRCIYWDENGEKHDIVIKEKDEFVLKGNSIAFVSLEPRFRIPYYIALRFNLKITHIHRGILLGTGPLVDPGFDGMLAIPLHNLTMNDYVLRGDDDLIWFDFTKINTKPFIDNLNDEAEVDDKNKLHRLEKYTEFPADKNLKDVNDYLYKAYRGHPVRSSLSEIKKFAEEAKRGTKRMTWAGIISIIVLTLALILPTLMLVTDTTCYVKGAKEKYLELNDQQSKRIESLENEVQSLNKRIEDLQKNSDKKALDSNSTMNMTVLPDATTKK